MSIIRCSTLAVFALSLAAAACDSPSQPRDAEPAAATYDLLYESFVSPTVLQQSLEGGQPTAPAPGITAGIDPTATLDGRYIAYVERNPSTGGGMLKVVDRTTGSVNLLTSGNSFDEQPAFSPDGARIAYSSSADGFSDIYVINRDGSGRKRLTIDPLPGLVFDHLPVWSPDGTRIVWSNNENGFMQLWVMNSDGSNQRRLTNSVNNFEDDATWSPDGARIAFFEVVDTIPRLVVINTDGTNRRVLPTPANGVSRQPAWSPDGLLIAFTFIPNDVLRPQIYTVKPDGTDMQLRTHDAQNRGGQHPAFIRR